MVFLVMIVLMIIVVMIGMMFVMIIVMVFVMSKLIVNLLDEFSVISLASFPQGRTLYPMSFV